MLCVVDGNDLILILFWLVMWSPTLYSAEISFCGRRSDISICILSTNLAGIGGSPLLNSIEAGSVVEAEPVTEEFDLVMVGIVWDRPNSSM